MKIIYSDRSKEIITLAEKPIADEIIDSLAEDTADNYTQIIARTASGHNDSFEILKVTAEIAKNGRVFEAYGIGTKNLDIWMEIYAFNSYAGFYEIGCYLTDIWEITADNAEEIRHRFFINKYIKKELVNH